MASGGRFLVLLVLLACIVQHYGYERHEDFGIKPENETKEEKRFRLAKMAQKRLFVWSKKLSTKEIYECAEALKPFVDQFDLPLNMEELMAIQEPKEAVCDNEDSLKNLKRVVKIAKNQYPAMHAWVKDALQKQMDFCNHHQRFLNKLEAFKAQHPDQWKMVETFYACVKSNGVPKPDWKRKFMDDPMMLNNAMVALFDWTYLRDGHDYQRNLYDLQMKAYYMATELRNSCDAFSQALSGAIYMNTFSPNIKKELEKLEWLKWRNVCDQAKRVNFKFAFDEINRIITNSVGGWSQYEGNRYLSNL